MNLIKKFLLFLFFISTTQHNWADENSDVVSRSPSLLFSLPTAITQSIVGEWLTFPELVRFDVAVAGHIKKPSYNRNKTLSEAVLQDPHFRFSHRIIFAPLFNFMVSAQSVKKEENANGQKLPQSFCTVLERYGHVITEFSLGFWGILDSEAIANQVVTQIASTLVNVKLLTLFNCKKLTNFSVLGALTQLTSLDLTDSNIDNEALVQLASVLVNLISLDVSSCRHLNDLGPFCKGAFGKLESLCTLGAPISNKSLTHLLQAACNLKRLHIGSCREITDFSPLRSLTRLIDLDLNYCNCSSDFSSLSHGVLGQLEYLSIVNSSINNTELHYLCSYARNLKKLNLACCGNITNLTPLIALEKLIELDLMGCGRLGDIGPLLQGAFSKLNILNIKNSNM